MWAIFPRKIPEEDVMPLPETSGFVVFPSPVIPEYVIVHAGVARTDTPHRFTGYPSGTI
jgi:hypothetical protein